MKLWQDTYKEEYNPLVEKLTNGRIKRSLRIGFSSYWFTLSPNLNDYITKNSKEAIYLRSFLKLGYVYWLGLSPQGFKINHERAIDCSLEFKEKMPDWDKSRFGTTPNYMKFCIEEFNKKLGMKLPDLDFVYMNLMPTFVRRNARNYVVLHKYAVQDKIPVLSYDLGLELVYQGVKEGGRTAETDEGKLMNISGYDYRDKAAHLKMAPKMIHLVQTGAKGREILQKGNPLLRFCTWWLPYHKSLIKEKEIINDPNLWKYPIGYVGNDNRRRGAIAKWFGKQPADTVHMFGGNYRKDLGQGWPEDLIKKHPNITFHDAVPIKDVAKIYQKSVATLNLSVPQHEKIGVQVWRHIEAPFGGCPLMIPSDVTNADDLVLVNDNEFLVPSSSDRLLAKIEALKARPKIREQLVLEQREEIKKRYRMSVNLKNLFREIKKEIDPKGPGIKK
jgi:hypothetical protein